MNDLGIKASSESRIDNRGVLGVGVDVSRDSDEVRLPAVISRPERDKRVQ